MRTHFNKIINHLFIIVFVLASPFVFSQKLEYNFSRQVKFTGEIEVENELELLNHAIKSSGTDTIIELIHQFIDCHIEYSEDSLSEYYGRLKNIKEYIHVLDINNDGKNDLIFDPFNWGCSLTQTYFFINENDNYKLLYLTGGITDSIIITNGKLTKYSNYLRNPIDMDFTELLEYTITGNDFKKTNAFFIYNNLIKEVVTKKYISSKTKKISITLYRNEEIADEANFDQYSRINITENKYKIFVNNGKWKLVVVRGNCKDGSNLEKFENGYYCGWTNEL